jgi:hypothetical protein
MHRTLLALAGLLAALALAPTAHANYGHSYSLLQPQHTQGKCLDVAHESTAHLANVLQGYCTGRWNQQWYLIPTDTEYRYFEIHARHSGKCLDVAHASQAHGADVIQAWCSGRANQQWKFVAENDVRGHGAPPIARPWGDGTYRIVARHSGKCLDVAHMSGAHAADVVQANCWNPGANQRWRKIYPGW